MNEEVSDCPPSRVRDGDKWSLNSSDRWFNWENNDVITCVGFLWVSCVISDTVRWIKSIILI